VFVLDKWYFDLVSPEGGVLLGHSAFLSWSGLRLRYDAWLFSPPDAPAEEQTSLRRTGSPRTQGDVVAWHSPGLGITGTWRRTAARFRRRLHRDEHGSILWLCAMPRARASVTLPCGRPLEGDGYVERLRLTIPPTDLPFDALHWGRFHGAASTLVWIEWQSGERGRWIFHDGREQKRASLAAGGVSGLDAGGCLRFAERRLLRDRAVLPALAAIPGIERLPLGRLAALHEKRWTGAGVLARGDGSSEVGTFIHEEVEWASAKA
jgi:hypothetical protein